MENLQSQWKYFVEVGVWPKRPTFDPYGWIKNFTKKEEKYAKRLLDCFTFYSDEMVRHLFRSNFSQLSKLVVTSQDDALAARKEWKQFTDNVFIVNVTGEDPNPTDSGFIFSRYARDLLDIPQERILSPRDALNKIVQKANQPMSFLFVDDFVGSGNQFKETWIRKYPINSTSSCLSFSNLDDNLKENKRFFYIPIICTTMGKHTINQYCSDVILLPSHYYTDLHNALNPKSFFWREDEEMQEEGPKFIERVSKRIGIPDNNGNVDDWRGFCGLGLALAFSHGWPDATLPLFYFDGNPSWYPLLSKK